jgi:hypothetical protein
MIPKCPVLGAAAGHVPREPNPQTLSAFLLFFIDKPTSSKIKSINSTFGDGGHLSGEGFTEPPAVIDRAASKTDAMEGKCSPRNASS